MLSSVSTVLSFINAVTLLLERFNIPTADTAELPLPSPFLFALASIPISDSLSDKFVANTVKLFALTVDEITDASVSDLTVLFKIIASKASSRV